MARISAINTIQARDISQALEWLVGDATTLVGAVVTDEATPQPQDLTGASFELVCEFYAAAITTGTGRNAALTISNLTPDDGRASKSLIVTVDPDQSANPGVFSVDLPADLYPGDMPKADLANDVPCAICYLRKTQGGEIRTVRFLIVFRRGVPS